MFVLKWALMVDGKVHDTECRQVIMSHLWHNGAALLICMAMDYVVLSFMPDTRYDNGGGGGGVQMCVCGCVKEVMTFWLTDWSQADRLLVEEACGWHLTVIELFWEDTKKLTRKDSIIFIVLWKFKQAAARNVLIWKKWCCCWFVGVM